MNRLWLNHRVWGSPIIIAAALVLASIGPAVWGQGNYPQPQEPYVNDFAQLLTADDAANIRDLFHTLKQEHGIEATVVTIDSINDYDTGDKTIEAFATNLFNRWGIGDSEKNNGVLLLVAVGDRNVRVEAGSGYGDSQNAAAQEIINEHILPSFRSGNFSQGIYRGARAIVGEFTGSWPPDLTMSTSASPTPARAPAPISSGPVERTYNSVVNDLADVHPVFYIIGTIASVGAAGFGIQRYLRYRKRRCPDCQTNMLRLDEISDDVYLTSGQKVEELLNSIDYDVWKCPHCNVHELYRYRRWFSGVKQCPDCTYRTLSVMSTTLEHPTYDSTGRKRVTKDCQHCDYRYETIVVIPKKTPPSDDDDSSFSFGSSSSRGSSSSFGGGRSSGGGASGSW